MSETSDNLDYPLFLFQTQQLYHPSSELCLELPASGNQLVMNKCDENDPKQIWQWRKKDKQALERKLQEIERKLEEEKRNIQERQ